MNKIWRVAVAACLLTGACRDASSSRTPAVHSPSESSEGAAALSAEERAALDAHAGARAERRTQAQTPIAPELNVPHYGSVEGKDDVDRWELSGKGGEVFALTIAHTGGDGAIHRALFQGGAPVAAPMLQPLPPGAQETLWLEMPRHRAESTLTLQLSGEKASAYTIKVSKVSPDPM